MDDLTEMMLYQTVSVKVKFSNFANNNKIIIIIIKKQKLVFILRNVFHLTFVSNTYIYRLYISVHYNSLKVSNNEKEKLDILFYVFIFLMFVVCSSISFTLPSHKQMI